MADIFSVLVAELNKDQVYDFAKDLLHTLGIVSDDPEPFEYE